MRRVDWRGALDRLRRLWRGSLRLRIVALTLAMSVIAITVIGVYISSSVRTNLFESRKDQVVIETSRAATAAQRVFNDVGDSGQAQDLESALDDAQEAIFRSVSTAPLVAILRDPGETDRKSVV
ncbi:MAG: hypothetical protein AB7K08_08405 [Microbacteriaceae bacterium]